MVRRSGVAGLSEAMQQRREDCDGNAKLISTPLIEAHPGRHRMEGAFVIQPRYLLPDPDQPRKHFDEEKLEELAQSIAEHGILQPLRVRSAVEDGYYYIVAGERRWRAAIKANRNDVPIIVRDSPADELAFVQLVENLQRENLSDQEEADAYRKLLDQRYSVRQIATKLGVSIGRISKKVRVYEDDGLAAPILQGEMTESQAEEILVAPTELRAPLVQAVVEARKSGNVVPLQKLRETVREARTAFFQGQPVEEVMESVSGRNTFRPMAASSVPANPRRTIDIAVRNLVTKIHSVVGEYPNAPMSPEVSAALDEAITALQLWRQRNGMVE